MDSVLRWLEPAAGVALMFMALLDLFLTVLYARAGTGFMSDRVARSTWRLFRSISKSLGKRRGTVLSVSGSAIVVALIGTSAGTLTVGAALIMHPYLGTSVTGRDKKSQGDFLTALFAGGSSMSLVGASGYSPQTRAFRMVYLFNSLVGMSTMSLPLTYIMQVYDALQSRNTFALSLDMATGNTGVTPVRSPRSASRTTSTRSCSTSASPRRATQRLESAWSRSTRCR